MVDLDRVIQSLYAASIEDDWQSFRPHALKIICTWLGAASAAWHTRSTTALGGSYTEYPAASGVPRERLLALAFPAGKRKQELNPLPPELASANTVRQNGYAAHYSHRGTELISIVLLRFAVGKNVHSGDDTDRALGHMIEASTLALRNFIQRDEWLHSLGRSNRGAAALVDEHGAIYAASPRFLSLLAGEYGDQHFTLLPCSLPRDALEGNGSFSSGKLHFRVSQAGPLFVVYLRQNLPLDSLSPREQEIARALGGGKTFKTVARQYGIAVSTVANHASRIYKKLGIFRREELMEQVRTPSEHHPQAPLTPE
jgi:DNA-binding CsgD family transcriptional regulator